MSTDSLSIEALKRAVKLCDGQTGLALKLGVKQGHVWHWLNRSKALPAERALDIERVTDGKVTRRELRPDLKWDEREPQSEKAEDAA